MLDSILGNNLLLKYVAYYVEQNTLGFRGKFVDTKRR